MASGTDQLASLRASVQAEQDRQTQAAIAASNPENVELQANAFPSNSNDEWLEKSVKELRDRDQEYAKLRSDQAREEWEGLTRANLIRQRQSEQVRADEQAAGQANQNARDEKDMRYLAGVAFELLPMIQQYKSEYSMPKELLAAWSNNRDRLNNLASRMGISPEELSNRAAQLLGGSGPQPQPDLGPQVTPDQLQHFGDVKQLPNGTYEVTLATGEVFRGDAETVMREQAKAQVHTKRYAQQLKQQIANPSAQAQPSNGNGSEVAENSFGVWAANENARALGFADHNEMIQWGQNLQATQQEQAAKLEEYENMKDAADFMQRCQDFPNTDQAIEALGTIIENQGWEWTPDAMEIAHTMAVRNGIYKPLTQQQISEEWAQAMGMENQQARRGTPPPMLRGSAPDSHGDPDANNPWKMGLADLRKAAIAQELNGGGQSR
jgi:hypothetical protein